MKVSSFQHNGETYEFQPPIEVPDEAVLTTLGQLAGYATHAASLGLHPAARDRLANTMAKIVNREIADKPESHLVLATLNGVLRGKHQVSIKQQPSS